MVFVEGMEAVIGGVSPLTQDGSVSLKTLLARRDTNVWCSSPGFMCLNLGGQLVRSYGIFITWGQSGRGESLKMGL